MSDYSLFPKREEWATGDEAVDSKLSRALAQTLSDLSLESIKTFNEVGHGVNLRIYNPSFRPFIELITRALLFHYDPEALNNELMLKMKSHYFEREKISLKLENKNLLINELKALGHSRYKGELDLYYRKNQASESNPFLKHPLKLSEYELTTKILMKDFKNYLNGSDSSRIKADDFFIALKDQSKIVVIENLGEFWFYDEQVLSLNLIEA